MHLHSARAPLRPSKKHLSPWWSHPLLLLAAVSATAAAAVTFASVPSRHSAALPANHRSMLGSFAVRGGALGKKLPTLSRGFTATASASGRVLHAPSSPLLPPSPLSVLRRKDILGSRPTHRFAGGSETVSATTPTSESPSTSSSSGRSSAAVKQQKSRGGSGSKSSQKMDLNPPKGTRDFYPEDMRQRNWLFGHWKSIAALYGFEEYDAPVLENEDLYIRKAGEEVTQQLYNFEDKGNRRVSLRPEMTPSLARMVMAKQRGLPMPLKWFSLPQCWRYERMTRGRRREHFQWNMDIWGVEGVTAEAELLSAITAFFTNVGLTSEDIGIKVNSRGAIQEILLGLGVPEEKFAETCVMVDKLEKMPREAIEKEMQGIGLDISVIDKILQIMEIKDIDAMIPLVGSESKALNELRKLFELADAYGFRDWLVFDASVVRGLAYYTGIVFEGFDRKGEFRAICGGGRYDKLLETFGGDSLPAVGFGFGDAVIAELLMAKGKMPSFKSANVPIVVSAFEPSLQPVAIEAASRLRQAGHAVDLILDTKKTKQILKQADRVGASYWVNVAPSEWESGKVVLKDLNKREQVEVGIDELDDRIEML